MRPELVELYSRAVTAHASVYSQKEEALTAVNNLVSKEELADAAYALRETRKYLEDLLKEVRALEEITIKKTCVAWVAACASGEEADAIRTPWCTATPDVRQAPRLPHRERDRERYGQLMTALGIPEDMWKNHETFRLHWPGVTDWLTERASRGEPLPNGLSAQFVYPDYKLRVQARKGVSAPA